MNKNKAIKKLKEKLNESARSQLDFKQDSYGWTAYQRNKIWR